MSKPRQHVVPAGDQWGVRREGSNRARNQQSELVIHRPDGTIRDSNSYGNDPYPPKG